MTSRERVRCALNHEQPDRVPIAFGGAAASFLGAIASTGAGAWQMTLASEAVKLQVPTGSASVGLNTAELTWTLQTAP